MKFAGRTDTLKASPTMEITAKAAAMKSKGLDVISLAAGEPDFNTPEAIRNAATKAMTDGVTRYTPAQGFLALREALAEKVSRENQFPVSADEIVITCGAKHALYMALQCLVEPGDTVLIPTPAWVSYGAMIELAGASFMPLPLLEEDGYRPNVDRWKGLAIPKNTRGIILNSPNNPTGMTYSREELIRLVSWALQRNLWIISDEVYEKLLYDAVEHVSIASLGPEVRAHTITISSVSKTYAMTGWRVGWAIGNADLISKMADLGSQSTSNVTSFAQWASIAALKLPQSEIDAMVAVFKRRRDYCLTRLERLREHLSYPIPNGAFYFFVNLSPWLTRHKMDDLEFCTHFLEQERVGLVPGSAFGQDNCFRLSYATSDQNLEKAFDRLERYLNK